MLYASCGAILSRKLCNPLHPWRPTQRNLAALHMVHHMAAGAAGAAGGAGGALTASLPLAQLATLDVGSLSRELRALRWIGQGGGGVVFKVSATCPGVVVPPTARSCSPQRRAGKVCKWRIRVGQPPLPPY